MSESRLPKAVLAALGLASTTACRPCLKIAETGFGPCLDYATETGTETGTDDTGGDDTSTSACLDYPTESGIDDTGTGPCLDVPVDTGDTSGDTSPDTGRDTSGDTARAKATASAVRAAHQVLAREVLPADVAARLRARRRSE